ncbi:Pyridoxal reductase, chloroplastic [Linum perenne]
MPQAQICSPKMAFSASTTAASYFANFASSTQSSSSLPSSSLKPFQLPLFWPWQKVKMGPMSVSPMGFGTWAWGNQLLWGYDESMDTDLQRIFNLAVENVAINWCICKGTIPIPGVKTVRQAEENLGALGWKLSLEEQSQLEYVASASPRGMIQNVFQTR